MDRRRTGPHKPPSSAECSRGTGDTVHGCSQTSGTERTKGFADAPPAVDPPTAAASAPSGGRSNNRESLIVCKIYPAVILDVAFLNHLRWPPMTNLSNPKDFGLDATCHFRLDTAPEVTVGAWHVLPEKYSGSQVSSTDEAQFFGFLRDGSPIILYLHGNAGTRAAWHRVQLYRVLSRAGFHVVTFDYRGYGDSSGYPSEDGIVEDSLSVFKWIQRQNSKSMIFIWGHSLGSGVATKTAKKLNEAGEHFSGLILESPFNNFIEAASNHPLTIPFRVMPWFSWVFIEGIKMNNILFASDENIAGVTAKTLILHAEDDGIVPYMLGRKLYNAALQTKKGGVEFVSFDGHLNYGHKHIHKAPDLPDIIRNFTSLVTEKAV